MGRAARAARPTFYPQTRLGLRAAPRLTARLACRRLERADGARTMDAQDQALEHPEPVAEVGAFDERRREVERHGEIHVLCATVDEQRARLGQDPGGIHATPGQLLHLLKL